MKPVRGLLLFFALLLPLTADGQALAPARVETVNFESKLVGQALPYHVVLPIDYAKLESRATRYPALYLLHGLAGHYDDWLMRTRLAEYAAQYRLIIITPEGNNAWYTDSAIAPAEKYESYIMRELIPDVQRRYRTLMTREGRAVAGLSMGGYGALKFGLKYPDQFVLAASMSGALEAASWNVSDPHLPNFVKPSIARAYGSMDNPAHATNDIFKLARAVPEDRIASLPFFYLDCGTEDLLIQQNRAFSGLLLERKIAHEFRESPGVHEWPYWDRQIQAVLSLAARKLAAPQMPTTARSAHAQLR